MQLRSKKWKLGAVLLAAVILAGAMTGLAFAGTDQGQDQAGKPDVAAMYQDFIAKFAANLGVGEDQVKAALETTKDQMIDASVQAGKLTQEQADKMKSDEGFGFFGFGPGREHGPGGPGGNIDALAGILGITADEIKADLDAGQKIEDIVTAHGLTMDEVHQKMEEQRKDEIAKAVADGKMTQEQADRMLQHMGPPAHQDDNQASSGDNN